MLILIIHYKFCPFCVFSKKLNTYNLLLISSIVLQVIPLTVAANRVDLTVLFSLFVHAFMLSHVGGHHL